ncbi:DUF3890 domain-containing protein, partial [Borrelia persica]|uniref:DUF3890 domain-containing protein n=1 Tax=Borrelia persica TaxID=44448 RepID=UPI0004656934
MSGDNLNAFYTKLITALGVSNTDFSFQSFTCEIELVEGILESSSINYLNLSQQQIFLLFYYYLGCKLSRKGIIREISIDRIKKEKFNELEIDYYQQENNESCESQDYCG